MKISINLSYDADKVSALEMFLKQKNLDINDELMKHLDNLYQRNVPQNVRDFIELKSVEKPKKQIKPVRKTEVEDA